MKGALVREEIYGRFVKTPYEAMLASCLAAREGADLARISELYRQCQDRRLLAFAKAHECASIVAARLGAIGSLSPWWEEVLQDWRYRLRQRFDALDALAEALDGAGIGVVALKNAGIARGIYPYYEECPMGDFDILVRKSDFARADEIVRAQGFSFNFRAQETIEEAGVEAGLLSGGTEYCKDLSDDTLWLELQWRSVAGRWISPEVEPGADELLASSIAMNGTKLRLLEPVMNLIQVCLHTAKHSYIRAPGLRLHTDVDRIVRAYPDFDWHGFLERVGEMHVRTAVFFSLLLPWAVLGTPVPEWVLESLRPGDRQYGFIMGCLERGGLFHPLSHKFGRLRYLAFTAALFDDAGACMRTAFPSRAYMSAHYGVSGVWGLSRCYARRFAGLLFRRVKT